MPFKGDLAIHKIWKKNDKEMAFCHTLKAPFDGLFTSEKFVRQGVSLIEIIRKNIGACKDMISQLDGGITKVPLTYESLSEHHYGFGSSRHSTIISAI